MPFNVGDRVVTRNAHPRGHTRPPRYARGKHGAIAVHQGVWVFHDSRGAREFAKSKGWTFSEKHVWIDDGISGAEWRDRHAFNTMLTALDTTPPPINVLIVSELSRIGRDTVRTPGAVLQIEESGVQIWAYLTGQQIHREARHQHGRQPRLSGASGERAGRLRQLNGGAGGDPAR